MVIKLVMNMVVKEPAVPSGPVQLHPEVADAVRTGRAVVALESTILAHGLPRGDNRTIADRIEGRGRAAGAVPVTIAVFDGVVRVGLTRSELDRLCGDDGIAKLSVRDVGEAVAVGPGGATTVASTSALAHVVGIEVFAPAAWAGCTGARRSPSTSPPISACSAAPRSWWCVPGEVHPGRAGHPGVPGDPVGAGHRLPHGRVSRFYLTDSGQRVPWQVGHPDQAAESCGRGRPLAPTSPPSCSPTRCRPTVNSIQLCTTGHWPPVWPCWRNESVTGKDVTPRLLGYFHSATHGESLRANVELVLAAPELSAAGVRCRFAVDRVLPTCWVVVVVGPDGDRTLLSDRGANAALAPDDVTWSR